MKTRIGAIFFGLLCLGLGLGLIVLRKKGAPEPRAYEDEVSGLSNRLVLANTKLRAEAERSTAFENNLAESKRAFSDLTNSFSQVSANLVQARTDLAKTETALKAKGEEVEKRDARIADLEHQNRALDERALELSASITNLAAQIENTKRKLAASEGDKGVLKSNLKSLMAEKAELERQFNDIKALRTQVAKLKQKLTMARRRDWMQLGLFAGSEQKGAQKLVEGVKPMHLVVMTREANHDLNVAVTSDGGATVMPPPGTNGPPAAKAPPR